MKKMLILVAAIICLNSSLKAQTPPEWTVDVGNWISSVNFMRQSDVGTLVVSTPNKLIGIDPRTKKQAWETTEVKNIEESEFKVIEGTQYIMVEFQKAVSLSKNKTVAIFDSYTGKMVYNSRDEEIKVLNTRIVPELKGILIEGTKGSKYFLGLLDFASSNVIWTKEFGTVKTGGIGIGALKRAIKSHLQSIFNVNPVVDADGNFIMSNKDMVYCLNSKTGQELWSKEFKDDITDFILAQGNKDLYVVYDDKMEKVQSATGKAAYEKPIKLDGKVNGMMPLGESYVLMHSDGFNILNADGSFKWKKDASVGNISQVWPIADGFIALESEEKAGKIFKVSNEGRKVWSESLSDAVYMVEPLTNGVLYITTAKANILGYEKGKDVWKKDIKIKGDNPGFAVDDAKRTVYVFSNKTLSSFNLNDGSYKVIAEDVKLKDYDDDKEFVKVEPRSAGIFVQTNQNVALIKEDGTVVYNKNYREAGLSKGLRSAFKVLGVAAQVAGAGTAVAGLGKPEDLGFKQTSANTYEVTSRQIEAGNNISQGGDAIYSFAQARYYATQSAKNTVYILTKWDEGTGLAVVEKDNGNEINKIAFNDKTPQYIVDEADYKVYVIVGGKELRAYDLKK